jgi:hypothetical protein
MISFSPQRRYQAMATNTDEIDVPVASNAEEISDSSTSPEDVTEASWRDALPEDIRGNENFLKYTSLESFAKGHLNAVGMLGKPYELKVPDGEDERGDFYNKLGRPDSSEGYKFADLDGVPEELQNFVNGRVDSFRTLAHTEGLSDRQATNLYDWFIQGNITDSEQKIKDREQKMTEANDALKAEWGEMYKPHSASAIVAVKEFVGEDFARMLDETGLGNDPHLIKAFFNIGKGMMGDKFLELGHTGDSTPQELESEINKIQANPAYWDADSPERSGLVKQMSELMSRKHPEPAA